MSHTPPSPEPVAIFDNAYSCTLAFIESMGRHGVPIHVYGSSLLGITRWSRFTSCYTRCPSIDRPDEFLPWLRGQIRSGRIRRIAPTSDLLAFYLSELRDEFDENIRNTIPTLKEAENCLIKSRFAAACLEKGINTPATAAPDHVEAALEFAKRVGFPVVLKAKSHLAIGMAERGALVENESQLRKRFVPFKVVPGHESIARRYPELLLPLVQQFIPSASRRVYSVSGFKHPHLGILSATVSYKCEQWPPMVGTSTHQVGSTSEQILELGMLAVNQFVSAGIFELELLIDGDRLLAIDLNPRSFGFMNLDIARGNDLPWLWYQTTMNQLHTSSSIKMLPIMESRQSLQFYVSRLVMMLTGSDRVQQARKLLQDLRSSWISMSGHWRDPLPQLIAICSQLRHPGGLIRPYLRARHRQHVTDPAITQGMNKIINPTATEFAASQALVTGAYPKLKISSQPARTISVGKDTNTPRS